MLLAAVEQDADTRGAQARTVLEMAVDCIHEAHKCVEDFGEVIRALVGVKLRRGK